MTATLQHGPSASGSPTGSPRGADESRTPQWLLQPELGLCPCGCIGRRRKGSYMEKTIRGGAGLLQQVMFSEDMSQRRGLLQHIDPRVKLASLLVVLIGVSFLHRPDVLLVAYASTVLLALASGLPLGTFVRRVWLFVPIFSGIIVAPATLSIVTPGEVVWTLWHWHGVPQGFTAQGLTAALILITRVATSVSLVLLLTLTTPWTRLLAGLRGIGIPRIFILVVGMAYRYLFVLLASVTEMYESRRARTITAVKHDKEARRFVGATAGALVGKANYFAEEVHHAMVARGYRGEARTLHPPTLTAGDALCGVAAVALAVALVAGDRLLG